MSLKTIIIVASAVMVLAGGGGAAYWFLRPTPPVTAKKPTSSAATKPAPAAPTPTSPPPAAAVAPAAGGPSASAPALSARASEEEMRLVRLYEGMKPKEAANVMTKLDPELSTTILLGMRERQAGRILGLLPADTAAELTRRISKVKKHTRD